MSRKIVNNFKKKAVMFAMAGTMAFSGAAGAAGTAYANLKNTDIYSSDINQEANTDNAPFSHGNNNSVSYTSFRYKSNSTKVFIYPTVGPMLYYRVQGAKTSAGSGVENKSNAHGVPVGVQASFTNQVRESGMSYARLKMRHSTTVPIDSKGWWSPDSTKNYTIYG